MRDLFADGGTAFYDAAAEAYDSMRRDAGDERINAVVLLTDGEDTDSTTSPDALVPAPARRAARAPARCACSRSPTAPARRARRRR